MRHIKEPKKPITLSVEEEAILIDDQNEQNAALDAAVEETQRLGDIVVAMGDMQVVVSNTPEIGTVEEDLLGAVADMAVAGTDADGGEILEAMLPPEEGVSAEGFLDNVKATLAKIWAAIREHISKVWNIIMRVFQNVTSALKSTSSRIEKLKSVIGQANDIKERTKGKNQPFKGRVDYLIKGGQAPQHIGADFREAQDWAMEVVNVVADVGRSAIEGGATMVEDLVKEPRPDNHESMMMMSNIEKPMTRLATAVQLSRSTDDQGESRSSKQVLGGLTYIGSLPRWGASKSNFGDALKAYDSALKLRAAWSGQDTDPKEVTLTDNAADIKTVLEVSEDWVKKIGQQASLINGLVTAANTANKKIDGLISSLKEGDAETKKHLSAVLSINGKLNTVLGGLISRTISHGNTVANSVLDYAIQSCTQEPSKEAA